MATTSRKHIYIKAKYIGGVNKLGYVTGNVYRLRVSEYLGFTISRTDGEGVLKFENLSSFIRNWDEITHVEKLGK